MKKSFITALLLSLSLIGINAQSGLAPYSLNVKEFNELKVVDAINVEYFCNPEKAGTVDFESTPQVASAIIFEPNNKGKLEIKLANRQEKLTNLPVIRVYSSFLTRIENQGDSTVKVLSVAPSPKFEAKLVGNGKISIQNLQSARVRLNLFTGKGTITAQGKCKELDASLKGTGQIDAFNLTATDASCYILGTGWIKCNAADNLKISGAGTGTVTFMGNPITMVKALKLKVKRFEQNQ